MLSFLSSDVAAFGAVVLLCLFLANVLQRYWRLRHIPGPPLASVTNLWYLYQSWNGVGFKTLTRELHERYGPVVRVGPRRVFFAQPDAIPVIFSITHPFKKADSYNTMLAIVNGQEVASFITIRDERRVSAMKKNLSASFTTAAMLKHEGLIERKLQQLVRILEVQCGPVNISPLLSYWSFDVISEVAFSEDPGFMTRQEDVDDTLAAARDRFGHWHYWLPVPWLESLLFKNKFQQKMGKPSLLGKLAVKKIERRKVEGDPESQKDLLGQYMAAVQSNPECFSPRDVIGLTISTIHAGADTTANTLTMILANLVQNPQVLQRLQNELREATVTDQTKFLELNKLAYLDAVIKESLRVSPIVADLMEREAPPAGAVICGMSIPGGTNVAVSHHTTNRDASVWGSSPDQYLPARWVEADLEQRRAMERASISFGGGRRICIGQHLAMIEMKKALATLLTTFEICLATPNSVGEPGIIMIAALPVLEVKLRSLSAPS